MKRLLVTGRSGFVGTILSHAISADSRADDWQLVDVPDALDLTSLADAKAMVGDEAPHAVIHLAAQSFVPEAFRDPAATLRVNVLGTLNLLQALQARQFTGRLLYVSTGDVYGRVPEAALPVTESYVPLPRNPYAVSKFAAETLCRQWVITEGMDIVLARPFNHIGAGQSERFVVSDFARQIATIRRGARAPWVEVGDVDVTRDFTDARDVVRAYFALLADGSRGETYNVCSGREQSILALLLRLAQLAGVSVEIRADTGRMRKAEQRRLVGSSAKLHQATGWTATTPLDASLEAMLDHWDREQAQ
jgi:GDP-4-dehydro-6-deoxy-D-mannose reductase